MKFAILLCMYTYIKLINYKYTKICYYRWNICYELNIYYTPNIDEEMDILTITPNTDYNNQVKPNCYTNIVHIKQEKQNTKYKIQFHNLFQRTNIKSNIPCQHQDEICQIQKDVNWKKKIECRQKPETCCFLLHLQHFSMDLFDDSCHLPL